MSTDDSDYFTLEEAHTDPARLRKEREKARKLKKSGWWKSQLNRGICHYCGEKFPASKLTMDHIVPLARGGESTRGNIVPACVNCNASKKLETPAERLLKQLAAEEKSKSAEQKSDGEE